MSTKKRKKTKLYYEVKDDLAAYPEAWCYAVVGGRNTGKTYGGLRYFYEEHKPIVFTKRTNDDIDLLCAGHTLGKQGGEAEVDFSPYKSINRDLGTHVMAYKIQTGLGGFYNTADGSAVGAPVSYLVSLNAVHKVKGFDLSESEAMIVDEFIPQPWERVNRSEGIQMLELYKTISRDRVLRGRGELKLILFANAVNIWSPITDTLKISDVIADMVRRGQEVRYDKARGIFIRILKTGAEMMDAEENTGLYRAMHDTPWGRMAFNNDFAYNDFTKVKKIPLKGYKGLCSVAKGGDVWYLYYNDDGNYYMCMSRHDLGNHYDLSVEMEQKAFYYDVVIDVLNAAIDGRAWFEAYGMYDLIANYKRRYQVS